MDKYEYKVRADEIKDLIARGEYVQAAEIADTIDWRRVKSVMMLCTISDLYKINRRYEDARNMLLLAYERRPGGRTICYSLCELSIKMEDFVPAVNYYKEFVQVAPKDPGRYILQYKLYEAQDVSLEERIGVLEELKKRDYREKWAYELAYLYHRVGLGTRCVEECDELILWFGEGKYVIKAMELKMLHQPLTPSQQEKYDHRFEVYGRAGHAPQRETAAQGQPYPAPVQEVPQQYYGTGQDGSAQEQPYYGTGQEGISQEQPYYGTGQEGISQEQSYYGTGQEGISQEQPYYGTGQEEISQEQPYYGTGQEEPSQDPSYYGTGQGEASQEPFYYETEQEEAPGEQFYFESSQEAPQEQPYDTSGQGMASGYEMGGKTQVYEALPKRASGGQEVFRGQEPYLQQDIPAEAQSSPTQPEELDIQVKPMDMGQYNTINLQAELAAGLKEVMEEEQKATREEEITRAIMSPLLDSETESLDLPEIDEVDAEDLDQEAEVMEDSEVFFGETGELGALQASGKEIVPELGSGRRMVQETEPFQQPATEITPKRETATGTAFAEDTSGSAATGTETEKGQKQSGTDSTAEIVMAQLKSESRAEEQVLTAQPPKEIARVLSQESDGQISLVLPESEQLEKQITGQMNLEDVLKEWERKKQENAEKRKEEVRQHVLRHTGEMFTAFEEAVRDDLLAKLENENAQAQDIPEKGLTEEDTAEDMALEEAFYEEPSAEGFVEEPAEEYPGESEDWDNLPGEEQEEPEQEVIFGDADAVEELEEIEEAEETVESGEAENIEPGEEIAAELEEAEGIGPEEETAAGPEEAESIGPEEEAAAGAEEAEGVEPEEEAAAEPEAPAVTEAAGKAETEKEEAETPASSVEREKGKVRSLTKEEKELYGPYIQSRASREQLVQAIDNISMAAYTGNIIITGEEGMDTVSLAKDMIHEVQMTDSNFAGKVAKISGQALNKKDVEATINQMASGALIIQKASGMDESTVKRLYKSLQQESFGIIIILEDVKKAINKFLEQYPKLAACFTARMDVESLSNGTLVAFGRKYAREREYSIDDMGILALHTRIDEMQTSDHVVTVLEVKELVDNAIKHANRKTLKHFFDILFARRYDEEDMIVLTEKDFA